MALSRGHWIPVVLARQSPLVLALALFGLSCATSDSTATSKTVLAGSASRVVILLPMNVMRALPERLEAQAPLLWAELRKTLEAEGMTLRTLNFSEARMLWLTSIREARAVSSSAGFPEASRVFMGKLSELTAFDATVSPSLFVQGAVVSGPTAAWDGLERSVQVEAGAWEGLLGDAPDFGGTLPAASLHIVVLSSAGEAIHERQAGIALLDGVRIRGRPGRGDPRFELFPLDEPFRDTAALANASALALDPFVPRARPPSDPPRAR